VGVRYGRIGGRREKVWGEYRFSSLMKQNKKAKNYAVFCFAVKSEKNFFYFYDVLQTLFLQHTNNTFVDHRTHHFLINTSRN
jgi:hypothetical protein